MPVTAEKSAQLRFGEVAKTAAEYPGAQHMPLDYPGRRPNTSFVYLDQVILPVADSGTNLVVSTGLRERQELDKFLRIEKAAPLNQRFAVLAIGSNACPGRLDEKFYGKDCDPIVVLKGWIAHIDSVYAAFLADYGALPATVASAPGIEMETWVTLLTLSQLAIMNASERLEEDYSLVSVASEFRIGLHRIEQVYAYFDRRSLLLDGERVRVAGFQTRGAPPAGRTEREVLTAVLDRLDFRQGESIEKRHRVLTQSPVLIAHLNSQLAQRFTGANCTAGVLTPVQACDLQVVRWNDLP